MRLVAFLVGLLALTSVSLAADPPKLRPMGDISAEPKHPLDHQPLPPRSAESRSSQDAPTTNVGNLTQETWAGYVVHDGSVYSQVSARWKVPTLTYGSTDYNPFNFQYETTWVGIGGYHEGTLIQFGTESWVSNTGVQSNEAWYELIPAGSVGIPALPIAPGDIFTADMHCTANCTPGATQTWLLTLTNVTQSSTFQQSFSYASSMASAEWVLEAPFFSPSFLPLPNYGTQVFDTVRANNLNQSITSAANGMYDSDTPGDQTSYPSEPFAGDAFSVCYGFTTYHNPCAIASIDGKPLVSLKATPSAVFPGQSLALNWNSAISTSCTGTNFSTGTATSGSTTAHAMGPTNFGLSCTGAGGTTTTSAPIISLKSCSGRKCK